MFSLNYEFPCSIPLDPAILNHLTRFRNLSVDEFRSLLWLWIVCLKALCRKTCGHVFQVMLGAEWLELRCKHIPDRYEHLVRYVGWYSNRARGERAKKAYLPAGVAVLSSAEEPATEFAARARAAWARLIRKVYEADPLECHKCKGPMRVIALESRIRESSGASSSTWGCGPRRGRSPSLGPEAWPVHASLPRTYHAARRPKSSDRTLERVLGILIGGTERRSGITAALHRQGAPETGRLNFLSLKGWRVANSWQSLPPWRRFVSRLPMMRARRQGFDRLVRAPHYATMRLDAR